MYAYGTTNSRMRFSGLASGVDIDSIVEQSLQIERLKLDRVYQNKTLVEWKRDALKSVSSSVTAFANTYFSLSSPNTNIVLTSLFNKKVVNVQENPYVKITATANAEIDSRTITKISRAQVASIKSTKIELTENESVYNLTLSELAEKIGQTLGIDEKVSITINGETFEFDATQSVSSMISTINDADGLGARIIFNEFENKFEIKSIETGSSANVTILGDEGLFFGTNGLFGELPEGQPLSVNGKNAEIVIDGETKTFQSNIFTIGGITFELMADTTDSITFSVTKDIEEGINRIKAFIEDYNKLIAELEAKLSEPVYRDYLPLTDAQKKELKESEIKLWEEKARSGLLAKDRNIRKLLDDMRSAFSQKVGDIDLTFAEIGIKTGSWENKGKIFIDEDKLRSAIQKYGDKVAKMFNQVSNNIDQDLKYQESGLAHKLDICVKNFTKYIKEYSIASFDRAISNYETRLNALNELLTRKENALYEKYAAMEKAIAQLNNQSAWFFSQW